MSVDDQFESAKRSLIESGDIAAIPILEKLAGLGHVSSMLLLADEYLHGRAVAVDTVKAVKWAECAAKSKVSEYVFYLGTVYEWTKEYKNAARVYMELLNQSYLPAFYRLGLLYEFGRGVERSKEAALRTYWKGFMGGHLYCFRNVSRMLCKGAYSWLLFPLGILLFPLSFFLSFALFLYNDKDVRLKRI